MWHYAWRRGGIDALAPRPRADRGQSKLSPEVQAAILAAKRENPRRSINQIRRLLAQRGTVAKMGSNSAVNPGKLRRRLPALPDLLGQGLPPDRMHLDEDHPLKRLLKVLTGTRPPV